MKSVKSPAAGNPPLSRWASEEKAFDCLKWTREARDRINAEIAGMSMEEELRWWESRRPTNPVLAKQWETRKPPTGGRLPARSRATLEKP